jgi:HEXXH motif-containing protein
LPDFEQATRNVKSALAYIGKCNAPARCLVTFALKVLALGGVSNFPTATVSNSFYDSAGMAALTNVHLLVWSTEALADSIIHEAVHSLLFHVQLTTPFYHDVEFAREIMVRSPWTGRMLGLSAFVHACFVWFALWSFWKGRSESSLIAQRLGVRAQTGFAAKSPLSELSAKSYDCVSAEVRDAIHEMWCAVKNSSGEFVHSAK